jgi:integrase
MGFKHPLNRLTAKDVRTKGVGEHADGNGLYLIVEETGARFWMLRTVVAGRRRWISLGACRIVTLPAARAEASRLRLLARSGGDPVAETRKTRRRLLTFQSAAERVHATHAPTFRNEKHRAQWLTSLTTYVFPHFGTRPVDQVDSADVLKALTPIWQSKPETASRVAQRVKLVLEWAEAAGYREGPNPVDKIRRALPIVRRRRCHMPALAWRDVPAFVEQLRAVEAWPTVPLALEFLILTAARTTEALEARWDEIDRDAVTWTIPGARTKSGRPHRVPLAPEAIAVLDKAERLRDQSPFLFPGRRYDHALSNMTMLKVTRRLKYTVTVHGFRSSFRDWAAERTNFKREVCEAALAHVVEDKVEAAYLRTDHFEQRRSLMETWALFVTTPAGVVVAMRA